MPARSNRWDFSIYYLSGLVLREGHNPYTTDFRPLADKLGLEAGVIQHATDPPTYLLAIEPLSLMRPLPAYLVWTGINAAMLTVSVALLLGGSSGLSARAKWALVALAILYYPVANHFEYSQSKIPILLLLVLMMRFMEKEMDRAAGLCLAIASLLRIFPLLLVAYLFFQRRWRVLEYTVLGLVVGGLATVAIFGPGNSLAFVEGVRFNTQVVMLDRTANISLNAFVGRLFWDVLTTHLTPAAELARQAVALFAAMVLVALTARQSLRFRPGDDPDWRLFSLWVVLSVMLSPTAWVHYMVIILILFASIARAAARGRLSPSIEWLALLSYVAVFSANLPLVFKVGQSSPHYLFWIMIAIEECCFISLLIAYIAALRLCADWRPDRLGDTVSQYAASAPTVSAT